MNLSNETNRENMLTPMLCVLHFDSDVHRITFYPEYCYSCHCNKTALAWDKTGPH